MTSTDDSVCTIGIDVGSSGIRLLLLDRAGTKLSEQIATYNALKKQSYLIWDNEKRINVTTLKNIVENQLYTLLKDWPNINVYSLSISSIGPSLVLLSKEAQPLTHAFTYAYQGAQDYVKFLPSNFQERTGSLYSGALPYVQLLKIKESSFSSCFKITTINDYLTWSLTDLPLEKIFSTVPNASYTGLYSLEHRNWDEKLLQNLDLELSILPEIIPMGTVFPIKDKFKQLLDNFRNTYIVTGTIDGIDAFWATGVDSEDILIGSASSTGAFRRMRKSPKSKYRSRLIQMCQIDDNKWVELIPFNNVGTSFVWVGKNFKVAFKNFITESNNVNIERLEKEALQKLEDIASDLESYFLKIPLSFPYIEGEPRG
ncbi:MAG: FGGY family carbohydrate kinase, partial [Promethearchaeota archaeon]